MTPFETFTLALTGGITVGCVVFILVLIWRDW